MAFGLSAGAAALIGAVAAPVISGIFSSDASSSAANTQASAANNATAATQQQNAMTRQDQLPWIQQGQTAINQMGTMTAPGTPYSTGFTNADLNANLAPNYQFQLDQGKQALNAQNNATGGLVGGNALKGLNDYAQNYAANAYQSAYNNYNTSQTNIFNRLASIAGTGQTSANSTGVTGANLSNAANNYATSGAAAQAAGTIGSANAISGGLNTLGSIAYLGGNNGSNNGSNGANNVYGNQAVQVGNASYPSYMVAGD